MHLLATLRQETKLLHENLHVHPLLSSLLSEHVTLVDVQYALAAFYEHYRQLECTIPLLLNNAALPNAPVLHWLEHDLSLFPLRSLECTSPDFFKIDTLSLGWGYLYTKQGSMLGGSTINKHLSKQLADKLQQPLSFFTGYGNETGKYWKLFLEQLASTESTLCKKDVIQGAVASFKSITFFCDHFLRLKQKHGF